MNEYLAMLKEKKLTLIMSLPANDPALCRAAFEAGADAVKVHINVDHRASGTHFGRLAEEREALETMLEGRHGPMGLVIGGSLEAAGLDAAEAAELPFAFHSVYAHHLPVWAPRGQAALMAACDSSYSMELIAGMGPLGVDVCEASVIPGNEYGQGLSLKDLLLYRQIAETAGIPVVIPTQRAIRPEEVSALIRCGVKGLMIGAVVTGKTEQTIAAAVTAFRKAIDEVR